MKFSDATFQSAVTDEAGRARFRVASGSEVLLKAWRDTEFSWMGPIYLTRNEASRIDMRLESGLVAVGRAVDESGMPIDHGDVWFAWAGTDPWDYRLGSRMITTEVEKDGTFRAGPIERPEIDTAQNLEVRVTVDGRRSKTVVLPPWNGVSSVIEVRVPR